MVSCGPELWCWSRRSFATGAGFAEDPWRGAQQQSFLMNRCSTAKEIFLRTLERVAIPEIMRHRVRVESRTLHVCDVSFDLDRFNHIAVLAMGKAGAPMSDALFQTLEPALRPDQRIDGVLVSPTPPEHSPPQLNFFTGDHPTPGRNSRAAADAMLSLLAECDERSLVLFLISGGASAMVEKPLDDTCTSEDVAAFHRSLVRSGLGITEMNVLRKHFSTVKGGRLATAAARSTQCTLLVSDVPLDALDVIASGPSLPDPSTVGDCRRLLIENRPALHLPTHIIEFLESADLPETPKADHPAFATSRWMSVLSSDDLCEEAASLARAQDFHVEIDNRCDDWECRDAAVYLLGRMRELRSQHRRVCLVSAGELSVQLPREHGTGGRNLQFALECAGLLANREEAITFLSAGSDGADGNSPAAGAVGDETTASRAAAAGLDLASALSRFDGFPFFNGLGDAIVTGPTGNNVRDLRLLLSAEE